MARLPFWGLLLALSLLYLLLDGSVRGPVFQGFRASWPGNLASQYLGRDQGWVALVNGQPITRAQLNLATDLFLARCGKTRGDLDAGQLDATQGALLDELINDERLRIWSAAQPVEVPDEFLDDTERQFESRFAPGELIAALREQELSAREMRALLRERARQQYWLEEKTRTALAITTEQSREWYGQHGGKVRMPEMVRARHLFLSAVFGDSAAKEKLAPELARQLQGGRVTFEELCATYSDDERTKLIGGDLGYFSRARIPPDFAEPVFAQQPGKVGAVFRTSIGWHIVRVEEKIPAREITWEELRPEIAAYLENSRRAGAIDRLRQAQPGMFSGIRVQIFPRGQGQLPAGGNQ